MQRITNAILDAKVAQVNLALGYGKSPEYPTVGAVVLYGAYGSTGVHRIVTDGGGVTVLAGLGTKRETAIALDGILAGIELMLPWQRRDEVKAAAANDGVDVPAMVDRLVNSGLSHRG
jgi:hypothetical protein